MKSIYSFLCLLLLITSASSQSVVHQVFVLNEGSWGGPVTLGIYDPASQQYTNFATIDARFGTDILVYNSFLLVAADSLLLKYDVDTYELLASQVVPGIRELAVWNDQVLVSRGDVEDLPSYFQSYSLSDLEPLYELTTLSDRASEIQVMNDTAYVGINGFGITGKLAVVDLQNELLDHEIDLGPEGLNPENVESDPINGQIYTINNLDWSDASVSSYTPTEGSSVHTLLNRPSGCSGSALHQGHVYFQTSGQDRLMVFNTSSQGITDSLAIGISVYGLGIDPVNGFIYAGETDYTTYGIMHVYDLGGVEIATVPTGISPGTFAFDVRAMSGTNDLSAAAPIKAFPSPTEGILYVLMPGNAGEVVSAQIKDSIGRVVCTTDLIAGERMTLNLDNLEPGVYFLISVDLPQVKPVSFILH